MMRIPRLQCQAHGWQPTVLVTVYDRKSRPRDRPDRYVCVLCIDAKIPPNAGNSVSIGPDAMAEEAPP
jgi:hypothetical protein